MNKYLKVASERYKESFKKQVLINPISEVDGEIMTEITELFKKAGLKEAVAILSEYKFSKDTEIRDSLLELNTNYKQKLASKIVSEIIDDEEDDFDERELLISFNDFRGLNIKRYLILGFSRITIIDNETGTEYPSIVLNECDETASKKPMYANHILSYDDFDERDNDYSMLVDEFNS